MPTLVTEPTSVPSHLDSGAPLRSTFAHLQPTEGRPMDLEYLRFPLTVAELPIPPEHARAVDQLRDRGRLRTPGERRQFEETVRLRIYFGGMHVACVTTPTGRQAIAAGYPGTGKLRQAMGDRELTGGRPVTIESPDPWQELLDSLDRDR